MAKKFKFRYVNEIVGGFVLLTFLLLLAGVLVAGHAQHWFEAKYEIGLKFPAEGSMELQKGAEVMLLGAKVGSVQDIVVDDDGHISGTMRVRGPFMRFVRADSIALVKKKMVVTGDAYVELTRGTGAELPRAGGEIECVKDTEIIQMLEEALESIRKGALNTLAARANFTGRAITTEFAQETLRDLLRAQQQAISIPNIQKTVADYYGLQVKDLLSKRRTRSLARPRQVAMALAKELTEHSLPEIGDAFAGRDHTTVLHACRQIRTLMEADGKLREDWDKLIRKLSE